MAIFPVSALNNHDSKYARFFVYTGLTSEDVIALGLLKLLGFCHHHAQLLHLPLFLFNWPPLWSLFPTELFFLYFKDLQLRYSFISEVDVERCGD